MLRVCFCERGNYGNFWSVCYWYSVRGSGVYDRELEEFLKRRFVLFINNFFKKFVLVK